MEVLEKTQTAHTKNQQYRKMKVNIHVSKADLPVPL